MRPSTQQRRSPAEGDRAGRLRTRRALQAAATLVTLVALAGWLGGTIGEPTEESTAVPGGTAAESAAMDVVERYIAARNTWDAGYVRSLLTDNALLTRTLIAVPDFRSEPRVRTAADMEGLVRFDRATGGQRFVTGCRASAAGGAVEVACDYTFENAWSQALAAGPLDGSRIEFTVTGEGIREIIDEFEISDYSPHVWEVFREWVRRAHPGDLDTMYDLSGHSDRIRTTPDAVALWDRHTTEFVELVDGAVPVAQRFVEARNEWDAAAVVSLLADDVTVHDVVSTAEEYPANAQFEQATGRRFGQPDCVVTEAGRPTVVQCAYVLENDWSRALDAGPFLGSAFELQLVDGSIRRVSHSMDLAGFRPQVWEVFRSWLSQHAPGDADAMLDDSGPLGIDRTSPTSIRLWKTHSDQFLVDVTVSGEY